MTLLYARVRNQQRKETRALTAVTFQPVTWVPQVQVTFTRDVTGWLDRAAKIKWKFSTGETAYIDEDHAVEFISKGYATGDLPRPVSQDEQDAFAASVTTIGLGYESVSNNGNG